MDLLSVYANPYGHVPGDPLGLDHKGRPHQHMQYEPDVENGDAHLQWVGCKVVATELRPQKIRHVSANFDHVWEYATEPTSVPNTAYYRKALLEHVLLPADLDTHYEIFGTRGGYRDVRERIVQYMNERNAAHRVQETAKRSAARAAAHAELLAKDAAAQPPARDHANELVEWLGDHAKSLKKPLKPAAAAPTSPPPDAPEEH